MCHTNAAGITIGLETGQMNRTYSYPDGQTINQLDRLSSRGLFDTALPATRQMIADPNDAGQTEEDRAKAYLHANCSHCHRPGGTVPAPVDIDFRYETSLAAMNICGLPPQLTSLVSGTLLLDPTNASNSVVWERMVSTDFDSATKIRMPELGSVIPDTFGIGLIESWVGALGACPP